GGERGGGGKGEEEARRDAPAGRQAEAARAFFSQGAAERRGRSPVAGPRQPQAGKGKQAVDDEKLDCKDDAEQRQGQRQRPLVGRDKLENGRKQERNGDRAKEPGRPGKHGGSFQIVDEAGVLGHVRSRSRPPNDKTYG